MLDSCFVNAGSGAERVLVVGACVLVELVCVGVVCVLVDGVVVLGCVLVAVCETAGASAAVTVFVPEPHAASAAVAATHSAIEVARKPFVRAMSPWYSPPRAAFLASRAARHARERLPRMVSRAAETGGGATLIIIISDC